MKTLKKITNEKDVLKLQELSHKYKNACATEDWRSVRYMEKIQMLLNLFKTKYNLTETERSKLYVKFVLS